MKEKRYVIIGNSTAAIAAAENIRKLDKTGSITFLSEEEYPAYGRPLISYYLLGKTRAENMSVRPADFYEKLGATLRLGVRAERIDTAKRQVILRGGERIRYDKLLVATGSRPFVPNVEGYEKVQDKFTFMTFSDALALEKKLTPQARVLIVGAGLIGLKCFEGIAARVAGADIVDLSDRILPSILDETGADIVRRKLEEKGARFFLSDCVERFDEGVAHLRSGKSLPFDILVMAAGVRPNTELVAEAGGEVGRGIVVDGGGHTSLPDVYAAGDCTECYDVAGGERRVLALLPNASLQGEAAGTNMAGGHASFDNAIAMNAIGFFGTHVLTAGCYRGESFCEREGDKYKKLFFEGDLLVGFILIDLPERAGIYTSLVRGRTPLSEVDLDLLKRRPTLLAFSEGERAKKLAREV